MIRKISFLLLSVLFCLRSQAQYYHPADHVYQYSVKVGSRDAYLWLPPSGKYIRGVIISFSNLLERDWLEDPIIRKTAANEGLGIIWIGNAARGDRTISADMKSFFKK
jgi:hypothetical protein